MAGSPKEKLKGIVRDWVKPALIALVVVGSFRSAVADWNDVPTGSMKPTILEGERIFVNKLAYDLRVPFTSWRLATWADPQRGDVVVLFSPADDKRLVKRVVGVPGDRIALSDNRLVVNGEPLVYQSVTHGSGAAEEATGDEPSLVAREVLGSHPHPVMFTHSWAARRSFDAVVIPKDQYFVMGDNRDNSLDSRWFGFVGRDRIVGKATAVVASVDPRRHYLPRWSRFCRSLP